MIQDEIDVTAQIAAYDAHHPDGEEIAETEEKEKPSTSCSASGRHGGERGPLIGSHLQGHQRPDLLSRIDFVNEIMDYDRGSSRTCGYPQQLEEKKELEEAKAEQAAARGPGGAQGGAGSPQRSRRPGQKIHAEGNIRMPWTIGPKRKRSRRASWPPGNPNTGNATTGVVTSWMGAGGYMWPEKASKKITSPFGKRSSPGGIGSTNHKGVDIGGVGYTTQVLASKAGTVIVSQYSNSYGNYVVVSHGSGNTTLYAHMSSRSVSAGQYVQQGQVLGITGSTGNSTGPHLHFEITEGGVRVNPLNYLTGYVAAW